MQDAPKVANFGFATIESRYRGCLGTTVAAQTRDHGGIPDHSEARICIQRFDYFSYRIGQDQRIQSILGSQTLSIVNLMDVDHT